MISGYARNYLEKENGTLRDAVSKQEKTLASAKSAETYINGLAPDAAPARLDKVLSETMLDVYNRRGEHRLAVSQARVAAANTSGNANIEQYAERVPGTKLRSVKVALTGTYSDYHGLLKYLVMLKATHPVSITHLKVTDVAFEATIRVYGVL